MTTTIVEAARGITGGVDTHRDVHVAAALDPLGGLLGTESFRTDRHVHPHQLRHTLATGMINRGMSLEAVAALLGHRSMRMTLTYARISNRTVAEEYFGVTQAVEASYESGEALSASVEGANMRRIAAEH